MSEFASILIPVYNNALHLEQLADRLRTAFEGCGRRFELVFVNDGSRDDSWPILERLAAAEPRIKALHLSRNFGQHAAISAALDHASGDVFILMDADLQDSPEVAPKLLDTLDDGGHDIVYTLKIGDQDGWLKRATSRAFHSFVGRSTRTDAAVDIGTFRAFNRKVAHALAQYRERAIVYGPLMHTLGFNVAFLPVDRQTRVGSRSSYTFTKRAALAFQSIASYSTLPQKALLGTGSTISAATLLYMLVVVGQRLFGGGALAEGFTLLAVLLLFFIGIVMFSLGILGWYLFLIYSEVLSRPRYHVQDARNLPGTTDE